MKKEIKCRDPAGQSEELAGVLYAISAISKRLANKLSLLELEEKINESEGEKHGPNK